MVKAAPLTIGTGHFGGSRVTDRKTSVNNSKAATTTSASTVQANVRPDSGCDNQSSSREGGCVSPMASSSRSAGSGGSRRTGRAITFTGAVETISPSFSSISRDCRATIARGLLADHVVVPGSEHRSRVLGMQGNAFQKIAEDPAVNLLLQRRRHIEKADAALSRKRGPHYFGARLHLQPRIAQFKANAQLLPRTHRRHHLNSNAAVCEIAHDPAVRLIERDVGKCAEFVPVLRSCLTRGSGSCVHIHRRKSLSARGIKDVIPRCNDF